MRAYPRDRLFIANIDAIQKCGVLGIGIDVHSVLKYIDQWISLNLSTMDAIF